MASRPFRLFHDAERAWLAGALAAVVDAWARHWLPDAPTVGVSTVLPDLPPLRERLLPQAAWLGCATANGQAHLALTPALAGKVAALAFGTDAALPVQLPGPAAGGRPSLIGDLVQLALQDLLRRWLAGPGLAVDAAAQTPSSDSSLGPSPGSSPGPSPAAASDTLPDTPHAATSSPDADTWRRASGALVLEVELGDARFDAVLCAPLVRHWLRGRRQSAAPARPLLADRNACITGQRVALRLEAGSAEIEIGVLQSLMPGDVITLGSRVDAPLSLVVGGQAVAGRAYLGRVRDRKGLLIAPPTS